MRDFDKFYTPDPLAHAIVATIADRLPVIRRDDWILEPSVGGGAFARACRHFWPEAKIIGVDIDPRAEGFALCDEVVCADFATADVSRYPIALVVGNPPYCAESGEQVQSHVRLGIATIRRHLLGICSFLLRASYLHAQSRADLCDSLDTLQVVSPRPSFSANGRSDTSDYSVFGWRTILPERHRVSRLTWQKQKKAGKK
jgi:hypothetical protein